MIKFSRISNEVLWGRALRLPLRLIPKETVVPILQGANKGFEWIKGSGVNGYWLGSFEPEKQKAIVDSVKAGMNCYDIGAHVGFYTLLFSRLAGEEGNVFCFEPNPLNLNYLLSHLGLNNIKNCSIFPMALFNKNDLIPFISDSSMSHLQPQGESNLIIPVFTFDHLFSINELPPPDVVKIDVEGAELEVLEGMKEVIKEYSPLIFIALDDRARKERVLQFLSNFDYAVYSLNERDKTEEAREIVSMKRGSYGTN